MAAKSSQAFDYSKRLHYPREYRRFFGKSEVFRLSECTIFRVKNDLGHFRLGITLKARGSSIQRNKVKRQIREAMRQAGPLLGSYDYNVVVPSGKKLLFPFPDKIGQCLRRELKNALASRKGS